MTGTGTGTGTGIGIDRYGGGVVDPTANVIALVEVLTLLLHRYRSNLQCTTGRRLHRLRRTQKACRLHGP